MQHVWYQQIKDNTLQTTGQCTHRTVQQNTAQSSSDSTDLNRTKEDGRITYRIVFAYSVTPHAAAGFSPYFLMFGKQPRLPIDTMLITEPLTPCSDWVLHHRRNLDLAYTGRMQDEATKRKTRFDQHVMLDPVSRGQTVLLRNRPKGRNKIQDKWK